MYDKYIAALPEKSRKPVLRLMDLGKKDVMQGILLAYLESVFYYAEHYYDYDAAKVQ